MYKILKPVQTEMPTVPNQVFWHKSQQIPPHRLEKDEQFRDARDLLSKLDGLSGSKLAAFDFETEGTYVPSRQPTKNLNGEVKRCRPVGLALAWSGYTSVYINLDGMTTAQIRSILKALFSLPCIWMAHNLYFDGSIVLRELGYWPETMSICTYAMAKHWSGEGFDGQAWGLKSLQGSLLGWQQTNEAGIDGWLIRNGYWNQSKAADAYSWGLTKAGTERKVKPVKKEMWRCPPWVLGEYAQLDAVSTLMLHNLVLRPAIAKYGGPDSVRLSGVSTPTDTLTPGDYLWFYKHFVSTIKECAQAYLTGFKFDVEKAGSYWCDLTEQISKIEESFYTDSSIQDALEQRTKEAVDEHLAKEPERLKKDGTPSATWTNWHDKLVSIKSDKHLSIGSDAQLRWLFYDFLGEPVKKWSKQTDKMRAAGKEPTPAMDGAALAQMESPAAAHVKDYKYWNKKLSAFVHPYIYDHMIKGRMHPGYKVPEAKTGRLSSSEPNLQQIGKDRRLLELFRPDDGLALVDADFSAVENIVLAELSGDANMMALYGPDAKPNDPHLFTAAGIEAFAAAVREAGYDPHNPTPEGIASAKEKCYKMRAAAKTVNYAIIYGIGAKKLSEGLTLDGVPTTKDEATGMIKGWWNTYSGVAEWRRKLEQEWYSRGGWVRNGVGRPVAVADDKLKDLISRVVQSTAHDLLTIYIHLLCEARDRDDLPFRLAIPDWHDQTMCEVAPEHTRMLADLMAQLVPTSLNNMLQPLIPLKMEAAICETVADSKGV